MARAVRAAGRRWAGVGRRGAGTAGLAGFVRLTRAAGSASSVPDPARFLTRLTTGAAGAGRLTRLTAVRWPGTAGRRARDRSMLTTPSSIADAGTYPVAMPRYEYRCRACGETFVLSRAMRESGQPAPCPAGHDDTVKLLSTVALTGRSGGGSGVAAAPAGGGGCCGGGCGCG
jgi:putative FmdB family regulatory protein